VTKELFRNPVGGIVEWHSRAHRKRAAETRGWWIGAGFAFGSLCHAAVDNAATAVGALCFLAGALMLIREAARPVDATGSR